MSIAKLKSPIGDWPEGTEVIAANPEEDYTSIVLAADWSAVHPESRIVAKGDLEYEDLSAS